MSRPRVIFHIGGAKCGSSAIQNFMGDNHERLAENGILVPGKQIDLDGEIIGEQIWFFENHGRGTDNHQVIERRVARIIQTAIDRGLTDIVISAENLMNHKPLPAVLERSSRAADRKVVLYVRRQDDYFVSAWQQWHVKSHQSKADWLERRIDIDAKWLDAAENWAKSFGEENVIVRPFRRDKLVEGDVVADFFHHLGLSTKGTRRPEGLANRSFNETLVDIAHRIPGAFDGPHDNRFYEDIYALIGKDALKDTKGSNVLTLEERMRIFNHHESDNEELKRRFMPEFGDDPLFEPPGPEDVIEESETERLRNEVALVMRCVHALAKRI